ncbi:MAG TPA: Clp protease N-terminal domain-containing protein [Rubrobacteraceae bacterium]|nr:Clp protease N-terminal domain-containing protein [Rubrobacteraceae bacterium]
MFEGFTERSHEVVALAREEARHLNHGYADTEHILLGLRREHGSVAATVLSSFGVELDEVREEIETIVGQGERPVRGRVDLTPRAKKVLEPAQLEARQLANDHVVPEHLLLGLAREPEGVAARILDSRGIRRDEIQRRVLRALGTGE